LPFRVKIASRLAIAAATKLISNANRKNFEFIEKCETYLAHENFCWKSLTGRTLTS